MKTLNLYRTTKGRNKLGQIINLRYVKVGETIIDNVDYEKQKEYRWFLNSNGYAMRMYDKKAIYLHREIFGLKNSAGKGCFIQIDHVNRDRLDNRKENLREATNQQNKFNRKPLTKSMTSRYKGVSWHGQANKWRAYIKKDGKQIALGLYLSERDAAIAYNLNAIVLFGQFACLNAIN